MECLSFEMRQTFDQKAGEKPTEVMYLRELGGKCMFLNQTIHEALLDLFGDQYWQKGPTSAIGQTIKLQGSIERRKDGPRYHVDVVGRGHSTDPIGQAIAERFMERLGGGNSSLGEFLEWLRHVDREDEIKSRIAGVAIDEWPKTAIRWMGIFVQEKLTPAAHGGEGDTAE